MKETFPLQRLEIPSTLRKCLLTINLIESPHGGGVSARTTRPGGWTPTLCDVRWLAHGRCRAKPIAISVVTGLPGLAIGVPAMLRSRVQQPLI